MDNVAPTFINLNDVSGQARQEISISPQFFDPGTGDTFNTIIDWGDGSQQENPTPDNRTINATHTYAQAGQYTIQVGIQDDDGGQDIQSFIANVSAAPRADWQNPGVQYDVNGNDSIEPLDALLVINELSTRVISDPVTGALPPANGIPDQFLDVNGDDFVGPGDALLVINQLGNPSAALSAGVTSVEFTSADQSSSQAATDQAIIDLNSNDEEAADSRASIWDSVQEWMS